jgi:hypothetical protein
MAKGARVLNDLLEGADELREEMTETAERRDLEDLNVEADAEAAQAAAVERIQRDAARAEANQRAFDEQSRWARSIYAKQRAQQTKGASQRWLPLRVAEDQPVQFTQVPDIPANVGLTAVEPGMGEGGYTSLSRGPMDPVANAPYVVPRSSFIPRSSGAPFAEEALRQSSATTEQNLQRLLARDMENREIQDWMAREQGVSPRLSPVDAMSVEEMLARAYERR